MNEDEIKKQCSKMPNWKAPRHDHLRLDKIHERIATQLIEILEGTKEIPSWMMYRRTVLCQKAPVKGNCGELEDCTKKEQILLWHGQVIERPMILSHIARF